MNNILKKIKILITGATGGVGRELCLQFKEQGLNLFITSKDIDKLQVLGEELECEYIETNFNTGIKELTSHVRNTIGTIDVLVNCAGIFISDNLNELTDEDFDKIFNVNVKAPFLLMKEFSKDMKKQKWGRIINIGSNSAYVGTSKNTLYCATKHAILGISRSLQQELKVDGIRTYCFSPGGMQTPMGKAINKEEYSKFISPKEFVDFIIHSIKYNSHMVSDEIKLNRLGI